MDWSFDLGGESFRRVEFEEVIPNPFSTILIVELSAVGQTPSFLKSEYRGRLQVNVTATQASITILEADRAVDSKNYQFKVVPASDPITSAVRILVQCK